MLLTGFSEALAEDVGSDGDLVGDANLPLLGRGGGWRGFLIMGTSSLSLSRIEIFRCASIF